MNNRVLITIALFAVHCGNSSSPPPIVANGDGGSDSGAACARIDDASTPDCSVPDADAPIVDPDVQKVIALMQGGPTEAHQAAHAVTETIRLQLDQGALKAGTRQAWGGFIAQAATAIESDDAVQQKFRDDSLSSLDVRTIQRAYDENASKLTGAPTFQSVQGVDAKLISRSKLSNRSIIMVASQFNFLESPSSDYTPITSYIYDPTQGPAASIGMPAALFERDYAVRNKQLAVQPLFESFGSTVYKGGYFTLTNLEPAGQTSFLARLRTDEIDTLRIFAQWGIGAFGAVPMMEVFTAAPSFQGARRPAEGTDAAEICTLLVARQYSAIAALAALRSTLTADRVPLHLTLVGQGAFNNPPSVMTAAFAAVVDRVKTANVDVYFHGYSADSIASIQQAYNGATLTVMTAQEFYDDAP